MLQPLDEIVSSTEHVSEKRRYWFVRTNGGEFYEDFISGNFISVDYEKIALEEIRFDLIKTKKGTRRTLDKLEDKILTAYPDEAQPGRIANQLAKFVHDISVGDVVLIPSVSSSLITFGEVTGPAYNGKSKLSADHEPCPWVKRRRVRWLRTDRRAMLNTDLYRRFFTHQTISEVTEYGASIDSLVSSLYTREGSGYLVLRVRTQKKVPMPEMFGFGTILGELLDEYSSEENLGLTSKTINARINVQSEGQIILDANNVLAVIVAGVIVIAIAGGGWFFESSATKESTTIKAGIKSDGIIERVRQFLVSNSDRRMKARALEKILSDMKIENPQDLVHILKSIDRKPPELSKGDEEDQGA